MKIRKVGIPRLTADNLRDVVSRIVEVIDELQGAVGSPDQRAVRLGELLRARIARVDPRGELLLEQSAVNMALVDAVDDAAAAAAGVQIGGFYRTGSTVKVRVV